MSDSASIERLMLITDAHTLGALGITAEELTDPDTQAIAIRRDHPDLDRALRHGEDVIEVAGEPMNVRLRLDTRLLNAKTIALRSRGAIVINTARGDLIRDEDMLAPLDAGRWTPSVLTCSSSSQRSTLGI